MPKLPASPQHPPRRVTVAPADSSNARSAAKPSTLAWWQCGWTTTSVPVRSGGHLGRPWVVEQLDRVAAQGGQAAGLEADDRDSARDVRVQRGHRVAEDAPRLVELPGRHPGERAARPLGDDPRLEPGRGEHLE